LQDATSLKRFHIELIKATNNFNGEKLSVPKIYEKNFTLYSAGGK
jgi:hypothetical protein